MVLFAALGGIGSALIDLTPMDEKEKRAAKAGVWLSMAAAGAATGVDGASAAVGAVMAAKEIAGIVVEDAAVMQVVDAGAAVATAAVSGNYAEGAKVIGGAAVGAAVGGATGGTEGMASGMQLGTTLAGGDAAQMLGKTAGAAAGAGLTAATTNEASGTALLAGAQLGASVGGSATDMVGARLDGGIAEMTREGLQQQTFGAAIDGSTLEAPKMMTTSEIRIQGLVQGVGQGAGMTVAGVLHEERDEDRSWAESLQVGAGAGSALSGAVQGAVQTEYADPKATAKAPAKAEPAPQGDAVPEQPLEAKAGPARDTPSKPEAASAEAPQSLGVRESARRMANQTPRELKVSVKVVGLAAQASGGIAGLVIDQTARIEQEDAAEYAERFKTKRGPRREATETREAYEEARKLNALVQQGQRLSQLKA